MRVRVVCGLWVTMASFWPSSALSRVDLPAFGRPMMETNPERKAIAFIMRCGAGARTKSANLRREATRGIIEVAHGILFYAI